MFRDYQQAGIDNIVAKLKTVGSTLAVAATGTGKTWIFSGTIDRMKYGRCMVIAHRDELIRQAANKIFKVTGEVPDIEKASEWADCNRFSRSKIVVASVKTLVAEDPETGRPRYERFDPKAFTFIVVDEAHHAVAKTYRMILDHFAQNFACCVLGVTATPKRHDEQALGAVFKSVAMDYEITNGIQDGWLVPIIQRDVHVNSLDFSDLQTRCKDFRKGELEQLMLHEEVMHEVVTPTIELAAERKKVLVFTAGVHQAKEMCDIFNRHEYGMAKWVSGKTKKKERAATLEAYSKGEFKIMVNVGVFTEGYDEPGIDTVVLARPTKSWGLCAQMVGRGTRPADGLVDEFSSPGARREAIAGSEKPNLLVLDFVGVCGEHKLVGVADILGGNDPDEVVWDAKRAISEKGEMGIDADVEDELESARKRYEEIVARRPTRHVKAKANYTVTTTDLFNIFDIKPMKERSWHIGRPISEKMRACLERNGIDTNKDKLNYTQAKQILDEIISRRQKGLCTIKQARLIKRYGYETTLTMSEASKVIDQLAANGWRQTA